MVLDKIANFMISCQTFVIGYKIVLNDSQCLKMVENTSQSTELSSQNIKTHILHQFSLDLIEFEQICICWLKKVNFLPN